MSRRLVYFALGTLILLPLASSCSGNAGSGLPTIASTVESGAATTPVSMAPPTTTTSAPTITPAPTGKPAPTATPTVVQTLVVAVPSSLESQTSAAVAALAPDRPWRVMTTTDPKALLENGSVHAALLPDNRGYPTGTRPLAVAAPFASDWQDITVEQAQQIQAAGHDTLAIVPWHELSVAQRALTIGGSYLWDDDYPLQQAWSLHAAPEWADATAVLGNEIMLNARAGLVQLAAVGDVMLDRTLGDVVATGDIAFPFALVAGLLQRADYTVANLESALGDSGEPAAKSYTFRAPPEAAQAVAQAGIDLVSLANNHALDFGPQALLQGMALLEQEGISVVGAGEDHEHAHRPHLVTLNGMTFAFLAYVNVPVEGRAPYFDTASWTAGPQTPGMAWARPDLITADISDIRESVDHIIVILHSGYEYVEAPSPQQVAASRAAIDAGATLVIGHHAHILQGVEFRGQGAIVYGLGNFAFNIDGPPETAILNAWFDKRGLRQIRYLPATINSAGQPQPVAGDEAASIRSRIYSLSTYLN